MQGVSHNGSPSHKGASAAGQRSTPHRPPGPTLPGSSLVARPSHQDVFPVFDLGVAPYLPVQALQQRLRQLVAEGALAGILLLLEHEPVITLGSRGGPWDLRCEQDASGSPVPVVRSERGGQATLHAPGQLVCYPVVPIPERDLSTYVRGLEEVVLQVLRRLGLTGHRRSGHPGVYVAGDKIASVGLRCQRWVASHGTSINVSNDLSLFELIVSCGEPDLRQTSIATLKGEAPTLAGVKRLYVEAASEVFGWRLAPAEQALHHEVEAKLGLSTEYLEGYMPTAGFEPAAPGSGGQCSIP